MIEFPKDFLWGAATSAYQVEGNNFNSDWWLWEKKTGLTQSGNACRHYELFREDYDIAKALGHNVHRLSVEWARIEPEEGVFSEKEIQHYKDVLFALKERGIKPVVPALSVTLWCVSFVRWYYQGYCQGVRTPSDSSLNSIRSASELLPSAVSVRSRRGGVGK